VKRLLALAVVAALAGCSGNYKAPPDPDRLSPLKESQVRTLQGWVVTLGDDDAEARNAAAEEIRRYELDAGEWLFEGAVDADPERAAASRILLLELRRKTWEAAPRISDRFAEMLRAALKPGHEMRVHAWWWVALGSYLEDSRRVMPDPFPYLTDPDADVRRFAAILYVRLDHDVRKLSEILAESLEDAVRSPGTFAQWEPVFASLAAAGFDEAELIEVRRKLNLFLDRLQASGQAVPWWEIRAFFHRAGPGAEPLLASTLLHEPPGQLRRLAAISYGVGTQVKSELERAYGAKPNEDLAIALGNPGSAVGVKDLSAILEKTAPGTPDRWVATLALERGTGKWLDNAAGGDEANVAAARWSALADGRDPGALVSFLCEDGGAALLRSPSGLEWVVGLGPISRNMITREEPAWAVFRAPAWGESCADLDLALAWRLDGDRFLMLANLLAGGTEKCEARAERMMERARAAARVEPRTAEDRRRARAALGAESTSDAARATAIRELADGGDEDMAAIAAFLATGTNAQLRCVAYLTLWQRNSETSLLFLAQSAYDTTTKLDHQGIADSAAPLLLRMRFRDLGTDRLDAAGTDPLKWDALVREALKK
jgi:hypothetical protein